MEKLINGKTLKEFIESLNKSHNETVAGLADMRDSGVLSFGDYQKSIDYAWNQKIKSINHISAKFKVV